MNEKPLAKKPPLSRTRAWYLVFFSFFALLFTAVATPNFVKAGSGVGPEAVGLSVVIFVVCAIAFVCCPWRYTVAKGVAFVIVLVALVVAVTMVRKYFEPRPHSKNACISNLKQIEGAKANWALEEHKTTNDTPTARDLFGKDRYIAVEPKCPHGGVYTLGKVGNPPRCSIEGHSID